MREKLLSVTGGPNPVEFLSTDYFRVPFVQALELVGRRECYVEDGFAFVPLTRIVSIVVAKFRVSLSKSMALAVGAFGQVAHEEPSMGESRKSPIEDKSHLPGSRRVYRTCGIFDAPERAPVPATEHNGQQSQWSSK